MPYRLIPFVNQDFYHIFNRGVEKREVFSTERDYERFLQTLHYYQYSSPKPKFSNQGRFRFKDFHKNPKIVEIVCYCLMPNHFHLLIRQLKESGISEYISKVTNSYVKYYNTKHNRIGPLFQGQFKAIAINSDEQLLHLSRYIHLNPLVSELTEKLENYKHSSYTEFVGLTNNQICNTEPILSFFSQPEGYKLFIQNHQDYAKELHRIKHLLLDSD